MAKSFKARKKSRSNAGSKRSSRIDSTAGMVLPALASEPPPSAPESLETSAPLLTSDTAEARIENTEPNTQLVDALAETKVEVAPVEPEAKLEAKPEAKLEAKPEAKPEAKIEAKPEPKADPVPSESKIVAPTADISGEFKGFFRKSVDEIHLEEAIKEAPELEEIVARPPPRRVDRRARNFVVGVLGFAAAIGIAGAIMRKATPRASAATATAVANAPIREPAPLPVAPPPPPPPAAAPEPAPAPAPAVAEAPAPAATPAATPSATIAAPEPAPAAPAAAAPAAAAPAANTVAPAATTAAAIAPAAAPAVDEDEALSGAQLLSKARQAIAGGAASKAANYAKKAIAKGAGGSAYYVLGAAYQTMGSNGAAKNAYKTCAKAGAAEAAECASLADGL